MVGSHAEFRRPMICYCIAVAVVLLGCVSMPTKAVELEVEQPFSQGWMSDLLHSGESGSCSPFSFAYIWRNVGWGSNLNRILAHWTREISRGRFDFVLDVAPWWIRVIECPLESGETADVVSGWSCLFKPMDRLCAFESEQDLGEFLVTKLEKSAEQGYRVPETPIAGLDDHVIEIAAALLDHMHSNVQPWFQRDIEAVLLEPSAVSVRSGSYIGVHVRRGDKIVNEAQRIEVAVYLEAAASFIGESAAGVDSITGIWVASDDSTVLPEVQALASRYFPNVQEERLISISFRTDAPGQHNLGDELPTTSNQMTYHLYVGLHAELRMMSEAKVFVGTFSSNIARLVYLMREANGFPRNSTISVDLPSWYLG